MCAVLTVGVQELPHKPHETWSDRESLLSIYSRSMAHVQELNHDPELQSYRSFKAKTHKHLCQVISSIRIQGQGISLGTCFCYTFILLPLTGVFRCSSRLALSNIHVLTCLPGWDLSNIHVSTCQPGCQLLTYMSLFAKQDDLHWNLKVTQPLLKMENLFQIVCDINGGVSLMLGFITEAPL